MIEYYVKMLRSVNGHPIEKSAELHSVTGKVKKDTIVYTVYEDESLDAFIDCFKTLAEAQECARNW